MRKTRPRRAACTFICDCSPITRAVTSSARSPVLSHRGVRSHRRVQPVPGKYGPARAHDRGVHPVRGIDPRADRNELEPGLDPQPNGIRGELFADLLKHLFAESDLVHLIDGRDDAGNSEQPCNIGVAARLREHAAASVDQIANIGIAAVGITIVVAAGDSGSSSCAHGIKQSQLTSYDEQKSASWPAVSPWVLAVGGTNLSLEPSKERKAFGTLSRPLSSIRAGALPLNTRHYSTFGHKNPLR